MTPPLEPGPIRGPRILIVGVNWLGDTLFMTPALRALRKRFPDQHLACAVPARCIPLLLNNPYLNEVIEWDDKVSYRTPIKFFKLLSLLKKKRFNSVIFFTQSKTKAVIAKFAGIGCRIGYGGGVREKWLTTVVSRPKTPFHRMDLFLGLTQALGVPLDGRSTDFFAKPEAERSLKGLLKKKGNAADVPYVVVHAGGNWELKRWPVGHFVEWIQLFLDKYSMNVILCGTSSERLLCAEISTHFKSGRVLSLCGQTTLDELAWLLKGAQFLLSNDSGPIHLAASQKTKILGLFGPTSVEETGPVSEGTVIHLRKDVGCEVPCYFRSCASRVCMEWLSPREVFSHTAELIK